MAKQQKDNSTAQGNSEQTSYRSWTFSLILAAIVVGIAIIASATINPLFDRSVHWDWMAGAAPVGFAALTLALRKRWV